MKKFTIPLFAMLLLASCYPSSPTYTQQYDLVATNFDPTYNFGSKTTYSLPDKIVVVTGDKINDPNAPLEFVNDATATLIFNAINSNMATLGWTKVDQSSNPDVELLPAAMQTTTVYYYYNWGYYWGWYYPYSPGWGWYYPGYYPPTVSSYTTGTLLVSMADINSITPDQQIPVEWTMLINGLLTGDASSVTTRINSTINQAFAQSSYLNH